MNAQCSYAKIVLSFFSDIIQTISWPGKIKQGCSSVAHLLLRRCHLLERIWLRKHIGWPRMKLRRRPIFSMFYPWPLMILLLLPTSRAWKNERRRWEEGQSKIRGPIHSPYSMFGFGSRFGSVWGSAISTSQVK